MGVTVKLGTGKTVKLVEEYGVDATLRAAELSEAPADMSYAERMLFNIATVMVAVEKVDGKTVEEVTDKAVKSKEILTAFRKAFTDGEWAQLNEAIEKVFLPDPKLLTAFEIVSS